MIISNILFLLLTISSLHSKTFFDEVNSLHQISSSQVIKEVEMIQKFKDEINSSLNIFKWNFNYNKQSYIYKKKIAQSYLNICKLNQNTKINYCQEAKSFLEACEKKNKYSKNDPNFLYIKGQFNLLNNNFKKAIELFSQAIIFYDRIDDRCEKQNGYFYVALTYIIRALHEPTTKEKLNNAIMIAERILKESRIFNNSDCDTSNSKLDQLDKLIKKMSTFKKNHARKHKGIRHYVQIASCKKIEFAHIMLKKINEKMKSNKFYIALIGEYYAVRAKVNNKTEAIYLIDEFNDLIEGYEDIPKAIYVEYIVK